MKSILNIEDSEIDRDGLAAQRLINRGILVDHTTPMRPPLKPLITPIVNINGTSREALVGQLIDVTLAIEKAITEMRQAMPHGRDYPDPENTVTMAQLAWRERVRILNELKEEIYNHGMAIADQ